MSLSPADTRDAAASRRDAAAEARDYRAMVRDRRAREVCADNDPGFAARFLAAVDRDSAAGDRAEAFADRKCARFERLLTATTQVSPTLTGPRDTVGNAAAARSSPTPVTATDSRATTPQFSDGQAGSAQNAPTRTGGGAHAGPEGEPSAELFSLMARRRVVRQAQGMVMAARHVSAEDAFRLLLEAVHPDGSTLLDIAAALVEGSRDDEHGRPAVPGRTATTRT